MKVHVEFLAQLATASGGRRRSVRLDAPCTAREAIRTALAEDSAEFRRLVLDASGELRSSILMFLDSEQIDWDCPEELSDGNTIVLAPPIAGG